MLTLKHIGAAAITAVIATAMVVDTADARRGGGGAGCYQNILANTTVTNQDGSQAVLTSTVVITQ